MGPHRQGRTDVDAVQLAKHQDVEVTVVCSGANIALVKSPGADAAVDYICESFADRGVRHDVIFIAVDKVRFVTGEHPAETADDLVFLSGSVEGGPA